MPWNDVMGKMKAGTLKSGSGAPVRKRAQAVAIMLSEKRAAMHGKNEYAAMAMPKASHPHQNLGKYLHPKKTR